MTQVLLPPPEDELPEEPPSPAVVAERLVAAMEMLWHAALSTRDEGIQSWLLFEAAVPGDWVLLQSTGWKPITALDRVGYLAGAWTWCSEPEDEDDLGPFGEWPSFHDRARQDVLLLQRLDGTYIKWTNVLTTRIPTPDWKHKKGPPRPSSRVGEHRGRDGAAGPAGGGTAGDWRGDVRE